MIQKVKVKVGFLYTDTYVVDKEQHALTISEVAVDWQEPMVRPSTACANGHWTRGSS